MSIKYYIYLHIKLTNGEPFYIGKGCGKRAYSKQGRTKWWKNIVDKYGYDIILLEEGLTEEESYKRENYWIKRIGRENLNKGSLINLTDGGGGVLNPSKETRVKMREAKLNKKHSEEHKKKIRISCIGINKNKKQTQEHKDKIGLIHKNKPWTIARRLAELTKKNNKINKNN